MAKTDIVGGGTTLWQVDGKKATQFATTKQSVLTLAASDEGSFVHVAEASAIEVFDAGGKLQRTLELKDQLAPVAMAAVPAGSSLFLGSGNAAAEPTVGAGNPGALATTKPPKTNTVLDAAGDIAGSPPFQGAALVGIGVLVVCWLFIRWHDKRGARV